MTASSVPAGQNPGSTLRRCYSRVKEHGVGKRKSSYSIEQLEKVFGQGGWDSQSCQPVLINSSGLYQEMESDGSTMGDYSQEDWGNQELPSYQDTEAAIFGVGYNTRWREEIRYHYAEISSQVPLGKRLREYFNPEKTEGRVIMTKVQKMNWKNVYYKFLDITINSGDKTSSQVTGESAKPLVKSESREHGEESSPKVTYCYLGIAEDRTLQQCLFQHFQSGGKYFGTGESSAVTKFIAENCSAQSGEGASPPRAMYIKFIEVELDFLSAGSLVESLEIAIGYSLKFNK
ncbi:Myb/SANT-like DNA-binding domain-containing protein 2 [Acipenser ruthenus]|uniref:Myb/SANT-like DNA-binding domain-containing protein 2 n=1 Tax=Acipenser ruthenus TaxID=7906 RepID=A0A444UT59_ACIRT|nr:Myb/SANT-like DNA-binding domain-containing protein 2 [Acipenser ruthenus]